MAKDKKIVETKEAEMKIEIIKPESVSVRCGNIACGKDIKVFMAGEVKCPVCGWTGKV